MTEFIYSLANTLPLYIYGAVFMLMLINGAFNSPSSQLLYIFVGYLVTKGELSILLLICFGALGNTIGNIFLYEVIKRTGYKYIRKFIKLTDERSLALQSLSQKSGFWYIFFGKLIPGIKVTVPIAAGMTTISPIKVYTAFLLSSIVWASVFIGIGLLFGVNSQFTLWYGIGAFVLVIGLSVYAYTKYPELFAYANSSAEDDKK
jgi:membrane protein DedA with SNARE-associated domain